MMASGWLDTEHEDQILVTRVLTYISLQLIKRVRYVHVNIDLPLHSTQKPTHGIACVASR
jgi:hypothetical protein